MKVLLVEDDPAVREGMVDVLSEVAPVDTATTVEAALQRLQGEGVGLVVADLLMGNGRQGGRQVIDEAKRRNLPVIVCSGLTGADVREALGNSKPDAILAKPFQVEEVVALASRLILK